MYQFKKTSKEHHGKTKVEGAPYHRTGARVADLRGLLPKKVLELDREDKAVAVRIDDCIACRLCELRCPDLAIEVVTCNSTGKEAA